MGDHGLVEDQKKAITLYESWGSLFHSTFES